MNRLTSIASSLLLLPAATFAATRPYETGAFEAVSVAAGVDVEISLGASRRVIAENSSGNFDDLRIALQGNVLKIDRPPRVWYLFHRPSYTVRIITPALASLSASSGADARVTGPITGDFTVEASSGSDIEVTQLQGGIVKARASSGSDLNLSGTCRSLEVQTSSGSDLDAGTLRCETVVVETSSGSDLSIYASRSVTGKASGGSDVQISGAPPVVQVDKSSGADVSVGK